MRGADAIVPSMNVLGLTGGIGCGKSTVGAMLATFGIPLIDADQIARDVVAPGTEGLDAVVAAFGNEVLAADGTLDRKKLAAIVFNDDARRRELNALLHPRIGAESATRIMTLGERGYSLCLYEATLLVENESYRAMAGLVVVTAQPEVQRARVIERDGATPAEAEARIRAQLPLACKLAVATYVVDNSGTLDRLRARVADLYAELMLAYGSPRQS
jgi:dephospho-CoA kinase